MKIELLAPAGSRESLQAAAANGADAVYFGGNAFNARINAENFSDNEILSSIDFCHMRGIRVYMTLNTLVLDREMRTALDFARFLYKSGVDACIVQDIGLIRMLRRYVPELEIHASTQMGISTSGGLRFLESLGIKRAVLSRETSLADIKLMRKASDIELEAFVHGAMCVSFSGGCLFSSMIGGRSGNRGLCAQPCRKQAACGARVASDADYALSLGDMCMLRNLRDLSEAGITCVKIEGRMKKPEYVAAAVYAYRRAIDGADVTELDALENELYKAFNRGEFTKSYYYGDGCAANRRAGAYQAEQSALDTHKADAYAYRKNPVSMHLQLKVGENARLTAVSYDPLTGRKHEVIIEGNICEAAKSVSGDALKNRLEEQLKKLGGTVFHVEHSDDVKVEGDGVFIAVSEVNDLRRRAVSELEMRICSESRPDDEPIIPESIDEAKNPKDHTSERRVCARVISYEQACAAYEGGADDVILITDSCGHDELLNRISGLSARYSEGKRLYLSMPPYIAETGMAEWEQFLNSAGKYIEGLEINNWGQLEFAKRYGRVIAGSGLNVLNSSTCRMLIERGVYDITLSPELKSAQAAAIVNNIGSAGCLGVGVYGREMLMSLRHCPIRERFGDYGCRKQEGRHNYIEDDSGRRFPLQPVGIERKCGKCVNMLYNCVSMDIRGRVIDDVPDIGCIRLSFYDEKPDDVRSIVNDLKSEAPIKPIDGTTRGRWNS